jgi:hypothetical protein
MQRQNVTVKEANEWQWLVGHVWVCSIGWNIVE